MEFSEIKNLVNGYYEYFYTMLGCEFKLWYNKKFKEFVIFNVDKKTKRENKIIVFDISDLKKKVIVKCYGLKIFLHYFDYKYDGEYREFEKWDEVWIETKSISEIQKLLRVLEEIRFFGGRKL